MRIGIDASRAFETPRTGVGEYAFELIGELAKNTALLKGHEVVLFVRLATVPPFALPANWRLCSVAPAPLLPLFWTQRALAKCAATEKLDVFFSPSAALPLAVHCRTVYVFHGGEIRETPGSYSLWERVVDGFLIRQSLKKADAVVAVSATSAEAARVHYDAARNKVTVVRQGVNWRRQSEESGLAGAANIAENREEGKSAKGAKNLARPFILYLGAFARRKNVPLLIEAYNELRQTLSQKVILSQKIEAEEQPLSLCYPALVLAGPRGNASREIAKAIERSPFKKDIRNLGYVEESEKQKLLRAAAVLAAPSLAEGFGRTVLEALCYEKPVVIADIQTFRELYGTFSHLVSFTGPSNRREMAHSLAQALAKPSRETALARARESATIREKYSWETAAAMVARILADTAETGRKSQN